MNSAFLRLIIQKILTRMHVLLRFRKYHIYKSLYPQIVEKSRITYIILRIQSLCLSLRLPGI